MKIGKILKTLRAKNNLTLEAAGEIVGVDYSTYSRYEKDLNEMKVSQIKKLADYYEISVDRLLSFNTYLEGKDEPNMVTDTKASYGKKFDVQISVNLDGKQSTLNTWIKLITDINKTIGPTLKNQMVEQ